MILVENKKDLDAYKVLRAKKIKGKEQLIDHKKDLNNE